MKLANRKSQNIQLYFYLESKLSFVKGRGENRKSEFQISTYYKRIAVVDKTVKTQNKRNTASNHILVLFHEDITSHQKEDFKIEKVLFKSMQTEFKSLFYVSFWHLRKVR